MTFRSAPALPLRPSRSLAAWAAGFVWALALVVTPFLAPRPAAAQADTSATTERAIPDSAAIPRPVGFVNDTAHLLDDATHARLEALLDQLRRKTGAEFAVLTIQTTAPMTPTDYKVQVFQRWGLGQKGKDNGLLMLVAVDEHEVRFETGYGLEGTLPDGLESRIVRTEMVPRFRSGDFAGGIVGGVLACAARIAAESGDTLTWNGAELRYDGDGDSRSRGGTDRPFVAAFVLFLLVIIVLSAVRRSFRGGGPGGWYGGWGGGGFGGMGGFGGGGFGGGGGGFGGGSFGGFGGGASGGGGGGGKW